MTPSCLTAGQHIAGEDLLIRGPRHRWPTVGRAVLSCPGAGGDASHVRQLADYATWNALTRRLAADRWVVGHDAGGSTSWGNDASIAANVAARAWVLANRPAPAGPVHVIGGSMGGLAALNYAKAHPSQVASVVLILPVIDPAFVKAGNVLALGPGVDAAYGGSYVDADRRADHNPAFYAADLDVPIQLWVASDDPLAAPGSYAAFAQTTGAELHDVGALGHTVAATDAVDNDAIVAFLAAHD